MPEYVLYEKKGHIAYITLNRPERLNALGTELGLQLQTADTKFAEDEDAWVAIYTGAGERAFSAGRDLKEVAEQGSRSGGGAPFQRRPTIETYKPTIAAINGLAYGGGLEKSLSCDIRICSENATFCLAEVKVGLCPPTAMFVLPRLIGLSNAMWMLLSGEPIDAQEAHRIGLVTKVVPLSNLMTTATQMAETICENAPVAVRTTRQLTILGLEVPIDYARRLGQGLINSVWGSEDAAEGARAFVEKRKPVWKMR
jgi:enoyl-CoA hydratase/carnithine racemase